MRNNGDVTFHENSDGQTLLRRHWPANEPTAAILGVHGIGEHSGRYEQLGQTFAGSGFDTEFFDLRGHGQSAGRRGYIASYEQFHDDIEHRLNLRRRLEVPVVLLGHSLGGLIVASYLLSGRPQPDLVVLSAPAFGSSHSDFDRGLAKFMGKVAPKVFVKRTTDPAILSQDPEIGAAWKNDELVVEGTTGALAANSFREMQLVSPRLNELTLPTYVLHGEADELVPIRVSEPLEGRPNVTYRRWPEMRHECFNEVGREAVLTEVADWITANVS